jgi:hypothetical protein
MHTVHLAPMGYVYDGTLNRQGQPVAIGGFRKPTVTFCGIAVPELVSVSPSASSFNPVKVALPHDHEAACKTCLQSLAGKEWQGQPRPDQVQPLLF